MYYYPIISPPHYNCIAQYIISKITNVLLMYKLNSDWTIFLQFQLISAYICFKKAIRKILDVFSFIRIIFLGVNGTYSNNTVIFYFFTSRKHT